MSGNDDDEGSVVSAVLEEDICGTCGIPTMLKGEACPNVVLCDLCDGEYHLRCEGLSQLPQGDFTCSACVQQTALFADLNFDVSSSFPTSRKKQAQGPCFNVYTAAKPVELAWKECMEKGLMVVKGVFSGEVMRKLTHG
ncbi:hypothetical protein B484DRAFT_459897, partial [Ochromonadaceae sp. CCMP2298]